MGALGCALWSAMVRRSLRAPAQARTSAAEALALAPRRRGYRPPAVASVDAGGGGSAHAGEAAGRAAASRLKSSLRVRELKLDQADPRVTDAQVEKSLLYGALAGPDKVAFTGFYVPDTPEGAAAVPQVLHGLFLFGGGVCGHPGFVHGGALAAALDESFGVGYYVLAHLPLGFGQRRGFTANLTVDYRAPVPSGTAARVQVELAGPVDGRKVYLKASMVGLDTGTLHAEASALFVLERESD